MEKKPYTIGGRQYELPPVTLAQKALIAQYEVEAGRRLAQTNASATEMIYSDGSIEQVAALLSNDSAVFWSVPDVARFFACILVPEGMQFDASKIDEIKSHMERSTIEDLSPVLRDFFFGALSKASISMTFMMASKRKSDESAQSSSSTEGA